MKRRFRQILALVLVITIVSGIALVTIAATDGEGASDGELGKDAYVFDDLVIDEYYTNNSSSGYSVPYVSDTGGYADRYSNYNGTDLEHYNNNSDYNEPCCDELDCDCITHDEDCPENCLEDCCADYGDSYYDGYEMFAAAMAYEAIEELDAITVADFAQLNDAVRRAPTDGSTRTITVAADIVLTAALPIYEDRIIVVTGPHTLSLQPGYTGRHFTVTGQLTLDGGITLSGHGGGLTGAGTSFATPGGGVRVRGGATLTMLNATITNNRSDDDGGGVEVEAGGTFNMNRGTLSQNAAYNSGGGVHIARDSTFTMRGNATISGNNAHVGAGVGNIGNFTMHSGSITDNATVAKDNLWPDSPAGPALGTHGGGVRTTGSFIMHGGTISNNTTATNPRRPGAGGGVWLDSGDFNMTGGSIINNNAVSHGGGIYINQGILTISDGTISNNRAGTESVGGGVFVSANNPDYYTARFEFSGGVISNNSARHGGGVANQRIFNMSSTAEIHSNNAAADGGGVYNYNPHGIATFTGGTIRDNTAGRNGGGVFNRNIFNMDGGTISGNTAGAGNGGGINNDPTGRATISAGSIHNNTATMSGTNVNTGNGGGIFTHLYPSLTVRQPVNFAGNQARTQSNFARTIYEPYGPVPAADSGGGAGGLVGVSPNVIQAASVSISGTHPLNNFDINFIGIPYPESGITFHPNGGRFLGWLDNETITRFPGYDPNLDIYSIVIDEDGNLVVVFNTETGVNDSVVLRPTRHGYEFNGWYTHQRVGNQVTPGATIWNPAHHVLWARWVPILDPPPVNITFHPNGGNFASMSLDATITRFPGHTHNIDRYEIVVDAQGNLVEVPNTEAAGNGTDSEVARPTREGYNFVGWFTHPYIPRQQIAPESFITLSGPHTLWAHWEPIDEPPIYSGIRFHPYGGRFAGREANVSITRFPGHAVNVDRYAIVIDAQGSLLRVWNAVNQAFDPAEPIPTRFGYTFVGWSGWPVNRLNIVTPGATIVNPATHTFWAVWEPLPEPPPPHTYFGITFHPNGGLFAGMQVDETMTRYPGHEANVDTYSIVVDAQGNLVEVYNYYYGDNDSAMLRPTRAGYDFVGWFTHPAIPMLQIAPETVITMSGPHTLWAHWAPIDPTVPPPEVGGAVSGIPQTGDGSAVALWLAVLLSSMAGITALFVLRRRAAIRNS